MNSRFNPSLDMKTPQDLPDVASHSGASINSTLDWVGMSQIALPIMLETDGQTRQVSTRVQVYVNLSDPGAKGIHMSRLYLLLGEFAEKEVLTASSLQSLLRRLLDSHEDISTRTMVEFNFDYLLKQPALKSDYSGWKDYPMIIRGQLIDGDMHVELHCEVPYSSTCPCSAALARQLIQEKFSRDFSDQTELSREQVEQWIRAEASYATPHSQRSIAEVTVRLKNNLDFLPLNDVVSAVEVALQTPVQTAVKREDEQAFARLNGANLMFCEDAARRLKQQLDQHDEFIDYWLRVNHQESLHAHDAVSIAVKGVEGGYLPIARR